MLGERSNQRTRTRRAIIESAREFMREGGTPTMTAVADRALVSEATLYRYFPNGQALWTAIARADDEGPEPAAVLGATDDVLERVETMVRTIGWVQYDDEHLWRTALRAFLGDDDQRATLARSGQRLRWIDEALRPAAAALPPIEAARLRSALALVFGMESLVTLRDVCGLDPDDAKAVSLWAARALVQQAAAED